MTSRWFWRGESNFAGLHLSINYLGNSLNSFLSFLYAACMLELRISKNIYENNRHHAPPLYTQLMAASIARQKHRIAENTEHYQRT